MHSGGLCLPIRHYKPLQHIHVVSALVPMVQFDRIQTLSGSQSKKSCKSCWLSLVFMWDDKLLYI